MEMVAEMSVTSAAPLRSIRVASWVDADGEPDVVTAPSLGSLVAAGDFGADLTLTDESARRSAGSVKVFGVLDGAAIRAVRDLEKVIVGAMRESLIFAGVKAGLSELPTTLADFAAAARIGRLQTLGIDGGFAVASSSIAAASIGSLRLGPVAPPESERSLPFGIAADRVGAYRRERSLSDFGPPGPATFAGLDEPGVADARENFRLEIL
jgi:hypothetical protein